MPHLGLGTGKPGGSREPDLSEEEGRRRLIGAVAAALRCGYRLIDTALFSRTEPEIAAGIVAAGVDRSEVFIATKLLQMAHVSEDAVRASLAESLRNLNTDFVDLYLIHSPRAGRIRQVWPVLLALRERGLVRALGVSNFGVEQLEGMRLAGLELPEVNQVEVHCWRQMPELVEYHRKHHIATMCMCPLARGEMFNKTDLARIAEETSRTEAEVAIRWALQQGYVPIPRSVRPERIAANAAEGFELSAAHLARISRLDTGYMAARSASPCQSLPWALLADSAPDKALWDDSKRRKAEAAARHVEKTAARQRRARATLEAQLRQREEIAADRRQRD